MQNWTPVCLLAVAYCSAGGLSRAELAIRVDEASGQYTFCEGDTPVLTYHFGTVPVPEGVGGRYAVARSDYVHPLYGPEGEILTADYSPDHPHHRGIYWAWPEVTYRGERRDLHALQGVFARPVRIVRQAAGAEHAELEAENVWKWGDEEPIVRERAMMRVAARQGGNRVIDFEFRFEGLREGVSIARRGTDKYGGLNLRFSSRQDQRIVTHTAPPGAAIRRSWAQLVGRAPGGTKPVAIVILQSASNPHYPGDWIEYPNLNWLQPTFPRSGAVYVLDPAVPLVLKYRLVVCDTQLDDDALAEQWDDYATASP